MTAKSLSLSPREELLLLQKDIFRRNQRIIEDSISVQEKGFEAYQRAYQRRVRNFSHVTTPEELGKELELAEIVYVGDYHTNKQSQRGFLRILKMLIGAGQPLMVALELIHARFQQSIDRYLKNEIDEETFLKRIHLKKRWYFDLWESFQPIFDFSRYHGLQIFGVEAAPTQGSTLKTRDRACAKKLVEILKKNPGEKLLVFIGDLHIAPEHLPAEVREILKKEGMAKKDLIVYQNSAEIYWKLAALQIEEKTEIVRIDERSFCIVNTPPIVWQQSYMNWLEHEEGEIDFADAKHSFLELVTRIADFLEIQLPPEKEDVEVYTCGDLSFLERLKRDPDFTKKEIETIKRQIRASESYYIAKNRIAYLASLSLNHAAEEASHYLKHLCAGDEFPREPADAFYANVLHEALGFFGSKIINHHRKCLHPKDFESLILYFRDSGRKVPADRSLELDIAHVVLELKEMEKKGNLIHSGKVLKQKADLFFGVTHALGYMLGDRLYYALVSERISKEEIRNLYCDPFREEGESGEAYLSLIKKIGKMRLPRRV
ncbi:MAG: ChaN family lipoprotein [bacterium]